MRPVTLSVNLNNTSTTKVAVAQQIASAGNLTLAAAASAIDTSGAARYLLLTTGEDDTAVNYTITGLNADGQAITETAALPNHTTASSTKAYASVSSIALSAGITANMSVGTLNSTATAISKAIPLDFYARTGATIVTEVTGTIVYTVQETFDDVLSQSGSTVNAIWYNGSLSMDTQNTSGGGTVGANLLSLSSVNGRSQADKGATAVRLSIASYSNGATLKMRVITEANAPIH
jgi:hypothetical protein